jgi:hypothetical protein
MPTSKHKVLSSNPSTQILFWESPYEDEEWEDNEKKYGNCIDNNVLVSIVH